jgi:hypothetical protein
MIIAYFTAFDNLIPVTIYERHSKCVHFNTKKAPHAERQLAASG